MKQYKKGFTLIELLVVIAIIGILSTLAVVSLGNARTRARDSKRVADIRNTQTALEIYATDHAGAYPAVSGTTCSTVANNIETCCLDNATTGGGWLLTCAAATRLVTVPVDPGAAANVYTYTLPSAYAIQFSLESGAGDLTGAGAKCATPAGISNAACPAP